MTNLYLLHCVLVSVAVIDGGDTGGVAAATVSLQITARDGTEAVTSVEIGTELDLVASAQAVDGRFFMHCYCKCKC